MHKCINTNVFKWKYFQNGSKNLRQRTYCIEKGRENEYWGYVIRVEKNSYRLESGRVAKNLLVI